MDNNDNKNPFDLNKLTESETYEADPQDAANNKGYGIISYIWILVLVPILSGATKTSEFAKFHANQGVIVLVCSIALNVISGVFSWIPYIGWIISTVIWIADVALFILQIIGIVNAAKGEMKTLPVIGKLFTAIK